MLLLLFLAFLMILKQKSLAPKKGARDVVGCSFRLLNMEFDVFEPFLGVEARAFLAHAREVTMAEDFCIRVVEAEALEEFLHRYLLCEGTGVGRFAIGIESALIADGDAVGVVVSGVSSDLSLRAARVEGTILGDVVVVADGFETSCEVAGFQGLDCEVLCHTRGTAMQYD